jgi:hypothetical protein
MADSKLQRLTKYAADLQAKIQSSDVGPKNVGREKQYKEFLAKDLKQTQAKIDALKIGGAK